MTMPSNLQKIKRALISVSNKTGIIELARFLKSLQIEIISTGGTAKLLKDNKIEVIDISEFTGFPEIMDGRVKTLHPKVHGGLLAISDNSLHQQQAKDNSINSIDLVVINLYPFVTTVKKDSSYDDIIENIDIGGPSMIRSAAKNHLYKTVITDVKSYADLIEEVKNHDGATTLEFRKNMAREAFNNTAAYDQAIAEFFNKNQKKNFTDKLILPATLKQKLRYGENSHQSAALYVSEFDNSGIVNAKQLQGKELSYNNLNDADAAFSIAVEFDQPTSVIVKHANPCGVASATNIFDAYQKSLAADSKSAFGGIVAINKEIDEKLAYEISKIFYEIIIAPSFTDKALEIFASKKNLRLLSIEFKISPDVKVVKSISGGFLVQDNDHKILMENDLQIVSKTNIDAENIKQLLFAMKVCKHVKSNAIVVARDYQTLGIGAGQMNRVDSVTIACNKAQNFSSDNNKVIDRAKRAVLASDAFFPFADNIEIANHYKIKAIIAPGGSVRDQEVIAAADKYGIGLAFINSRHFRH